MSYRTNQFDLQTTYLLNKSYYLEPTEIIQLNSLIFNHHQQNNNQSPSSVESELNSILKPKEAEQYFAYSLPPLLPRPRPSPTAELRSFSISPRRQHTLQSLIIQSPRSRSPIVYNHRRERHFVQAKSNKIPRNNYRRSFVRPNQNKRTRQAMDDDSNETNNNNNKKIKLKLEGELKRRISLNPFEAPIEHSNNIVNSSSTLSNNHRPLISNESFEKCRSVYEKANMLSDVGIMLNDLGNDALNSQSTTLNPLSRVQQDGHLTQQQQQAAHTNDIGNPNHEEGDLSLDEILANIQEGRLQSIDDEMSIESTLQPQQQLAQSLRNNNQQWPQQQTEMQEFKRLIVDQSVPLKDHHHSQSQIYSMDNEKSIVVVTSAALVPSNANSSSSLSSLTHSCHDTLGQRPLNEQQKQLKQNGQKEEEIEETIAAAAAAAATVGNNSRRKSRDEKARQNERATGFEIAWLDFTYSIEPNFFENPKWGKINSLFHKEHRMILKGLSGGLRSGQMVALMGPSGAGKTCLLESISGVRTTGIGGRMCLRGRKRAQLVIVPQYDDFMPQFTVEETIIYGSRMKNGYGTNHHKVTNKVIDQLGLQVCRSNNIQRCSGGQRKRVAIAQELVSRPNILILDEPTSGLDSSCCYHTMKVLREVLDQSVNCEEPMAIVSTIHQPSAKVFKMFDSIYLLGKTGHVAYSGPPDELVSTIRDVTGLECPKYSNPSDFMIELVAYDYGEEPVERLIEFEKQKGEQFKRDFIKRAGLKPGSSTGRGPSSMAAAAATSSPKRNSIIANSKDETNENETTTTTTTLKTLTPRLTPSKSDTNLANSNKSNINGGGNQIDPIQQRLKVSELLLSTEHVNYKNNITVPLRKATSGIDRRHPFIWHTWVHLHRSFLQAIRDPILNNMRILIHLGFAILLVLLYGKKSGEARGCPPVLGLPQEIIDPNHESMIDLADNVGYLFMCIMMITYVSLMSTVLTFPIDIKTVGKEYKNGWYGTVTYFLGKTIADMPFIILYPVAYCLITWYVTNQAQDHFWRYLSFTGLIIMNAMNSQSFGLILGALFVNSVTAATFLGPVITIPWYLFTGFTKRVHRLSEPFRTTSKFLFTRYVFEGALDTVYGHNRCNCSEFLDEYYKLRFEEANRLGQLISMETLSSLDYYDGLETVANVVNETLFPPGKSANNWFERTVDAASTVFADGDDLNLASLMDTNVKASSMFSFGLDFEPTCPKDYESFVVKDFKIGEDNVQNAFFVVFSILCVIRIITFGLVAWKIKTRQL